VRHALTDPRDVHEGRPRSGSCSYDDAGVRRIAR
jgi:hypothetical protein